MHHVSKNDSCPQKHPLKEYTRKKIHILKYPYVIFTMKAFAQMCSLKVGLLNSFEFASLPPMHSTAVAEFLVPSLCIVYIAFLF